MSVARLLVVIVVCFVAQNEASRILAVFPIPSISHQVVFRPLILELLQRGHEVIMVTTDPIFKKGESPSNLTQIDVHDLSYKTWREEFLLTSVTSGNKDDRHIQFSTMLNLVLKVVEKQFLTSEMQNLLNDKTQKFDLLLFEAYVYPLLGLPAVFDAPVILISSLGSIVETSKMAGAPIHPFVYPFCIQQRSYQLTFLEKIWEIYDFYQIEILYDRIKKESHELARRLFGNNVPSLPEMIDKVEMIFVNVHPIWDMNRPMPPNVIYMGGLHQRPEEKLPQDLQAYLDSSKHGVIYISFGTNVEPSLLPPEKIQTLIDTFSKLPYDILWKWNKDELPGKTKNIKISKWLPQSDLLRHPNVKLFITQGGLQSTDEAITAGVPLIGMPMLGDQWFNVDQYERHQIGLRVDMETITEEKFRTAINTILNNKSYRDNILRLGTIMRDQPQTPLERATWWTEYVLRHGGAKHLRSPAANMTLAEYLEIELILYLVFGLGSVMAVFGFAVYYIFSLFKPSRLSKKLKSN